MRPVIFVQRRSQQVDAPIFRELTRRGIDCRVVVAKQEIPVDPEMGIQPNFGDITAGYRVVSGYSFRIPDHAHVVVAGWNTLQSWQWAVRAQTPRSVTLGIRFDFVRFPATPEPRTLSRLRSGMALRLADVWHPTGELSRASAERLSGIARPSILFPYVSDDAHFRPQPRHKIREPLKVLAVSKLNRRESVEVLIRAVAMLSAFEFELDIVGDGPLRNDLENLADSLGVKATFHGYVPFTQLSTHYASADIFVHPSEREVWGVSIQEAMLSGLPVIASDRVGAAIELLDTDVDEWQFRHSDPAHLAEKLQRMRDSRVRWRHSSQNLISVRRASASSVSKDLEEFLAG